MFLALGVQLYKVNLVDWSSEGQLRLEQTELKLCPRKASARRENQRHISMFVLRGPVVFVPGFSYNLITFDKTV